MYQVKLINFARMMNNSLYHKAYFHEKVVADTFIIPDGVTDLATDCLRCSEIGTLVFPDSLKTIGTYIEASDDQHCVLANCKLGTVVLPVGLEVLGTFAFGNCEIDNLHIYGKCLYSQYARQIKGAHVKNLIIHSQGYGGKVEESGVYRSIECNARVDNLIIL